MKTIAFVYLYFGLITIIGACRNSYTSQKFSGEIDGLEDFLWAGKSGLVDRIDMSFSMIFSFAILILFWPLVYPLREEICSGLVDEG
jgi:hypothetical protein